VITMADVQESVKPKPKVIDKVMQDKLAASIIETVERVEDAYSRLNVAATLLGDGHTAADVSADPFKEFDLILGEHFAPILFSAHKIGGRFQENAFLVYGLLAASRGLVFASHKCKKPGDAELNALLATFTEIQTTIDNASKQKVEPKYAAINSLLLASVVGLNGWFSSSDPVLFLRNRRINDVETLLVAERGQSDLHHIVGESICNLFKGLENFAEKFHKSGLVWSGQQEPPSDLSYSIFGSKAPISFTTKGISKPPRSDDAKGKLYCEFSNQTVTQDTNAKPTSLFYCNGATITLRGKTDSITIDGCINTTVVIEDNVNTIEISHCYGVEIIVSGVVGAINVSSTVGLRLVLSPTSSDATISTSATVQFIVNLTNDVEGKDVTVHVPRSFKHTIGNGKVETTAA